MENNTRFQYFDIPDAIKIKNAVSDGPDSLQDRNHGLTPIKKSMHFDPNMAIKTFNFDILKIIAIARLKSSCLLITPFKQNQFVTRLMQNPG